MYCNNGIDITDESNDSPSKSITLLRLDNHLVRFLSLVLCETENEQCMDVYHHIARSPSSIEAPFHTYCVAVGSGTLDHTPVIDWYSKEVESLMKGKDYYCSEHRQFIHAKVGVVAVLADRPEKAFMLKISLLGTYGQISSWAAAIEPNVLADCKRCFNRRISVLLLDRHSASQIRPCQHCCQWDLCSTSDASK